MTYLLARAGGRWLAHAPNASPSGRVPIDAPLRCPAKPLAGAAEPPGPCQLCRLAALVLAGCHRSSPVGSPFALILAG